MPKRQSRPDRTRAAHEGEEPQVEDTAEHRQLSPVLAARVERLRQRRQTRADERAELDEARSHGLEARKRIKLERLR